MVVVVQTSGLRVSLSVCTLCSWLNARVTRWVVPIVLLVPWWGGSNRVRRPTVLIAVTKIVLTTPFLIMFVAWKEMPRKRCSRSVRTSQRPTSVPCHTSQQPKFGSSSWSCYQLHERLLTVALQVRLSPRTTVPIESAPLLSWTCCTVVMVLFNTETTAGSP